jgi:hypothetical protein
VIYEIELWKPLIRRSGVKKRKKEEESFWFQRIEDITPINVECVKGKPKFKIEIWK